MSIHFRTLFELEVDHGYYAGPSADLDFIVPATEPALAAGKLLTRVRDGRLRVLFEADGDGHALRDIHGTTMLIGLRITNPYFANFTASPIADADCFFYGNQAASGMLDAVQSCRFIAPRQTIVPLTAERPMTLRWQKDGNTLVEQLVPVGQTQAGFETRDWPSGRYLLSEIAGGPPVTSHWLHSPALAGEGLWGAVALTVDRDFYANPPMFRIALQARSERLQYYVVARNFGATEFGQLQLTDAGAVEQGRPALGFDKIAPDAFADTDLPPQSLGEAGARIVLFQSQGDVPRRAGGYRKLQLKRNNEILVQHLPQAGSDRAQARFIVHLAKP